MRALASRAAWLLALIAFGFPRAIFAHAFGQSYVLPVPFWMYAYGAAAALLLSFLVIGYLSDETSAEVSYPGKDISDWKIIRFFRLRGVGIVLKGISVALLLVSIVSGFIGENVPQSNINMALFWIILLLGMTYTSVLFGDIWRTLNPWRVLCRWYGDTEKGVQGIFRYPEKLGIWPACVVYVGLIWFELVGKAPPFTLSVALLLYTIYTMAGAWLYGEKVWFSHAEFFSVFFGFIAKMSPLSIHEGKVRLRLPFVGVLKEGATSMSEVFFVLFMIASTSFDGFQETLPMLRLYLHSFAFVPSFDVFRTIGLFFAPVLFLGVYLCLIWCAKRMAKSVLSVRTLALHFVYTLIPIALAYNIAHYYTLLLIQGQDVIRLLSDPLGYGWNIFGTAGYKINISILQAGFIWHSEVIALLIGHIASVYLAHVVSLRVFKNRKKALLAEIPMLILMMAFTVAGLWILSQPITSG